MTSFTTFALQTYAANNTVQVASTANMVSGVPITFAGTAFGNIAPGANYYVGNITAVNNITLTTLPGGATWPVANGTGNMTATFTGAGQEIINTGTTPNDGTGSPLRTAFTDTNVNFDQIFAAGPVGSNIRIVNNTVSTVNTNGNLVLNPNGIGAVVANAHVIPDTANIRNLGSQARRFATVYTQYLDVNQFTNLTISTANLHITGGSNGYFLQTDGTGNLTWSAGSGGTYGNANVAAYLPTYSGNIANLTITGNLTVIGNTVQANIVEQVVTVVGNITGGNLFTANTVSAGGNVVAGNITTIGLVSATGNVFGNYILGNGSQLTGLPATYSNSNVVTLLAAFGSNTISTTGNITAGGFTTTGSSGNITGANYVTANVFALTTAGTGTTSVIRQNQNPPVGSEPFGIELSTISDTAGIYSSVSAGPDYVTLNSSNGGNANIVLQGGYGVTVSTTDPTGGNEKDWTFGIDGNLTLPSNTSSINYANGNPYGGGSYGNANVATFLADFGNNDISTSGNVTTDNLLVLAGIGPADPTASPAPSINGFDSINAIRFSASGNIAASGAVFSANLDGTTNTVLNVTANSGFQSVNTPGVVLQVTGQIGVPTRIVMDAANSYVSYTNRVYGGTPGSPTGVAGNTLISRYSANPYTSTGWLSNSSTRIELWTTETQTTAARGSKIVMVVTPTGTNALSNIATFSGTGLSVAGNIISGNILFSDGAGNGIISGVGAVYGDYFSASGNVRAGQDVKASGNVTAAGNILSNAGVYATGIVSAAGNVRGGNINTVGLITATGNVYGNNISTTGNIVIANGRVDLNSYGTPTFNSIGYGIAGPTSSLNIQAGPDQNITLYTLNSFYSWKFDQAGNLTAPGNVTTTGNVYANYFVGDGSQLTGVATQVTGSWTLSAGTNTVSLSVPLNGTYSIWVNGNIPNGIVTYTATVVVTNTNVPVVGSSYGWYYAAGNALVLTAIPTQIVGTVNNISNAVVATTTANVFTFGITNNSGNSAVVNWGYTRL